MGDGWPAPPGTGVVITNAPCDFCRRCAWTGFPEFDRYSARCPIDWIDGGDGLLDWLEQAQLVPADALRTIRAQALPGELDKVADQAGSLREWFRGFVREHKGHPLTAKVLPNWTRNRLLERDESLPDGSWPGAKRRLSSFRHSAGGARRLLLLSIGEALAQFVCTEDFSDVKACEGPACTLLFADHTRGHTRRWCSMAICGNRAKQAAHRHRLKAQQQH